MAQYKTLVDKVSIPPNMKTKQKDYESQGTLAIVDQGKKLIGGYTSNAEMALQCKLPVIVFGDHTCAVKFVNFPFGAGADGIKVLSPKSGILPKYLFYGTQYLTLRFPDKGYARHYQHIEKMDLPVPSIETQQNIVSSIEELFSELDKGVETLQTIKEQLAVYRQAVLKDAFTYSPDNLVELSEIVENIKIGPFGTMLHKEDYICNGVPVINPQHIKNLSIKESPKITVSSDKADELSSYKLNTNDIIMARRGEMGRAAAVSERENGWICGTGSILFRLKKDYDASFYVQILSSPNVVHYLEENATGTTMKNLNEKIVCHIPVPKVTKKTQTGIIQKLEEKLSLCNNIEQTVDTALAQAEAMRQSILKKAFEGELCK